MYATPESPVRWKTYLTIVDIPWLLSHRLKSHQRLKNSLRWSQTQEHTFFVCHRARPHCVCCNDCLVSSHLQKTRSLTMSAKWIGSSKSPNIVVHQRHCVDVVLVIINGIKKGPKYITVLVIVIYLQTFYRLGNVKLFRSLSNKMLVDNLRETNDTSKRAKIPEPPGTCIEVSHFKSCPLAPSDSPSGCGLV